MFRSRLSCGGKYPEIPDSSKWSSNNNAEMGFGNPPNPEIPDSSKWSSNDTGVSILSLNSRSLKYQIPVSGVQTF